MALSSRDIAANAFCRRIRAMRRCAFVLSAAAALVPLLWSCREEDKLATFNIRAEKRPTMTTHNVMTVISDSGIPQYRLVGPVWYVYDNLDTPLWILPGGPYLEKFDRDFNIEFTVACDSAVNNRLTSEWLLMGNVEYRQEPGTLILTQQLRWNQRSGTVSSDSFIHLEQPGKVIEGYGFIGKTSANGRLNDYKLRRPKGVLPYIKPGSGQPAAIPGQPTISGLPQANTPQNLSASPLAP